MGEHQYLPDVRAFVDMINEYSPRRVLLLGADDLVLEHHEVRVTRPPDLPFSNGVFLFSSEAGLDAMVSVNGQEPGAPERVDADSAPLDHPIIKAHGWFEFLWSSASPVDPRGRFIEGDFALLAGTAETVRILEVHRDGGHTSYTVQMTRGRRVVTDDGLEPITADESDPLTWLQQPGASAREFTTSMTVTKLRNPLTDTVYSYLSSKTVMYPYQFKPVLRLLHSPHQRLLIADEVGLGKTIEAGLIWSELDARHGGLGRVLVVCPASLQQKWHDEMLRRFDRRVPVLDANGLREMLETFEASPDEQSIGIASLERLRNPAWLAELNEAHPHFDLIIVDEAHYLRNRDTRSYELGQLLSSWADVLVFLSATPLNLGNEDLFNLLTLLVPEEFHDPTVFPQQVAPNRYVNEAASLVGRGAVNPRAVFDVLEQVRTQALGVTVTSRPEYERVRELCTSGDALSLDEVVELKRLLVELNTLSNVLTRTRKVDVPEFKAEREPVEVRVRWTDEEARLYEGVRSWAMDRAKRKGGVPGFVTQMPLRQAASCLPAVVELIEDRVAHDVWLDDDDFDDLPPGRAASGNLDDGDRAGLADLRALVSAASHVDTKFHAFARYLQENRAQQERVLLFSFFRRTLRYLHRRLSALGYRCAVLDGGVKMRDRQPLMNAFREGEIDILLCSEVGSEGLDFEFCNMVVNYDLPWNPMRVEQRIGRLDRFGQKHEKIFVLNFHVPGTIETDIFERLYERIGVFRQSIGELEPILRTEVADLTQIVLDPELTDDQRRARIHRIEVATEEQSRQIDDIQEAQAYLSGLDQLLIDGFEADTESRGRFIGPQELKHLLNEYFRDIGEGRIKRADGPLSTSRHEIVGGSEIGDAVARVGSSRGSLYSLAELAARMRDEDPLPVTFSNEEASRTDVELMSLHHPITRAAVTHLAQRPLTMKRFASLTVQGLPDTSHTYLVVVQLAETTGLRPALELWPLAMDLDTGALDEKVGDAFLNAVARGSATDGPPVDIGRVSKALSDLLIHARSHQRDEESKRRQDNQALVDSRLETRRAGIRNQIARAQRALEEVRLNGGDQRIVRLRTGQIRNLEADLARLPDEMQAKRQLALSTETVAVAVLHSPVGA